MAIDKKKAILPKQLIEIKHALRSCPIDVLKSLSERTEGAEREFYLALSIFAEAPFPRYGSGYYDPIYDVGREHMIKAYEGGSLDGLRLAVLVETGLSVKVKPKFEDALKYIKELYERTNDEELRKLIDDWDACDSAYYLKYEDACYSEDCAIRAAKSPITSYSGSHDEAYYDTLTQWYEENT